MPDKKPDAEAALHKLGQRLREGFAKENPIPEKSLETVKDTVREQWEQERKAEREKTPAPDAAKEKDRQPPEPDRE